MVRANSFDASSLVMSKEKMKHVFPTPVLTGSGSKGKSQS